MNIRVDKLLMMDSKLTLKLDKHVIEKAEEYAASHKRSLSRLIESYLKTLIDKDDPQSEDEIEISEIDATIFVKILSEIKDEKDE